MKDAFGPDEVGPLLDLWVAAWTAAMPAIDFATRRDWFATRLSDSLAAGGRLIVRRDQGGVPTGFALVNAGTGYLDQLAVDPAYQGRGVATSLLTECKQACPTGLSLHVNTSNARAIRFYARHGFVVTGEAVNPRSGLPVWLMAWSGPDAESSPGGAEAQAGPASQ